MYGHAVLLSKSFSIIIEILFELIRLLLQNNNFTELNLNRQLKILFKYLINDIKKSIIYRLGSNNYRNVANNTFKIVI